MPLLSLKTCNFDRKKVFLRADLNVPLKNNSIIDDKRLQAILPTLQYLIKQNAHIILATHIGNPKLATISTSERESFSTKHLVPWFTQKGITVLYASDMQAAHNLMKQAGSGIILLENLRLFAGEKSHDPDFAKELASLADCYVNDAFGTLHRADTSITLVPKQFKPTDRAIGFCVEREMAELNMLKMTPQQPFMLVLGGAKLEDKIPLIRKYIASPLSQRPTCIIIGGALAIPFIKAQNPAIQNLECSPELITLAQEICRQAQAYNVTLLLPNDLAISQGSLDQPAHIYPISQIPPGGECVDIGPSSIVTFCQALAEAKTIFANGTMGMYEYPAYQAGCKAVISALAHADAYTVIGGGDCAAAAHTFGLENDIDFISTGGGATLAYLAAHDPFAELPGLAALIKV